MCLLVSQSATTQFDDHFIKGVYRLNSDGLGVMYAEGESLFINRIVPKTEKDFVEFFKEHIAGRDCAWHARMKTHGDIDLTNCHPYQVLSAEEGYPLWLAHNGILHTGNFMDKSKSDTWHYIQDYLRPMLLKNPEFFMTEAFAEIIGDHIGTGNKFILMDAYGNRVVINEDEGVTHEGSWLSNTYAWDTSGTVHDVLCWSRRPSRNPIWPSKSYANVYGIPDYDDDDLTEVDELTKLLAETEAADTYVDTDCDDFTTYLFDMLDYLGFDHKHISILDAEDYYKFAGSELAWGVIEGLAYGAYTEEEITAELTHFQKAAA